MGLQLKEIFDPRDPLRRIRRKPLENFMKNEHPDLYKHNMPADVMRMLLRERGIHDIPALPKQRMGQTNVRIASETVVPQTPKEPETKQEVDHLALLKAEFESVDYSKYEYRYLQKLCKTRGIKMARTDRKPDLVRKLNGENPA